MILALSVVVIGVTKLRSGTKISKEKQNKLMFLRVFLQALVISLIGIIYYFSKS